MGKKYLTEEETVQKWFDRINSSLQWRSGHEETWDRIHDYLKTRFERFDDGDDCVFVNMVHPHVRVVLPAIYSRNPEVIVKPRINNMVFDELIKKRAEVFQNLLRYYIKELGMKTEGKLCILDGIISGHAWVKTGYKTDFTYSRGERKTKGKILTAVEEMLKGLGLSDDEDDDSNYEINEKIASESPWVLRTSFRDVIVPMLSKRPDALSWIVERCVYEYEEVMDSPEFDHWDRRGLKPSISGQDLLREYMRDEDIKISKTDDYLITYEIWDGRSKDVHYIADGHNRFLEADPIQSQYTYLDSRYHPFVMLRFNEIDDEFYPVSDIEPAEPQIEELNSTRTQMMRHRKRYNRRYFAKPGALNNEARNQLREGIDGDVIELEAKYEDDPVETIIAPVKDAPLPVEVYQSEQRARDDMYTILGTSDYASQSAGGARSATEAQIIANQSRFRVEERIDLIGDFLERICRNIGQMLLYNMDKKRVMEILGEEGIYWKRILNKKRIRREFDFNLIYGSTAPINLDIERAQFSEWYAMTKDDPLYDPIKARVELNRKYKLDNPESWLVENVKELVKQRQLMQMQADEEGDTENAQDRSGSQNGMGRVPDLAKRGPRNLRERQAAGGMVKSKPRKPGGTGGTQGEV